MTNELLNTISDKLQQVRGQSLIEKKREKEYAEEQMQGLEQHIQERKARESIEISRSREHAGQLNIVLDDTFRSVSIQNNK